MLERIKSILYDELNIDPAIVVASASFKDDLGIDSLDLLELVLRVEEEYDIEIPAEKLETLVTVGHFLDYLTSVGIEI